MKVKALATIYAGSDVHPPGTVFTINPTEGQNLVARGFAEAVLEPTPDEDSAPETRRKK